MVSLVIAGGNAALFLVLIAVTLLATGFFLLGLCRPAPQVAERAAPSLPACAWAIITVGAVVLAMMLWAAPGPTAMPAAQVAPAPAGFVPAGGSGESAARPVRAALRSAMAASAPPEAVPAQARRLAPRDAERLRQGEAVLGSTRPGAPRWLVLLPDARGEGVARVGVAVEAGGAVVAQVLDSGYRSLATFSADAGAHGIWAFRPDGEEYHLVVLGPEEESRFAAWLD